MKRRRDISHYLLNDDFSIDRSMIMRRARYEHQRDIERGGDIKGLAYWTHYYWRVGRGQRERAAFKRLEAAMRDEMGRAQSGALGRECF